MKALERNLELGNSLAASSTIGEKEWIEIKIMMMIFNSSIVQKKIEKKKLCWGHRSINSLKRVLTMCWWPSARFQPAIDRKDNAERCFDGLITPKYALNSVSPIRCDNVPEIIFFILALCLKRTRDFFLPISRTFAGKCERENFSFSLSPSFESDSTAQERFSHGSGSLQRAVVKPKRSSKLSRNKFAFYDLLAVQY